MASTSGLIVSWHVVMMPLPMTLDCGEMEGGGRGLVGSPWSWLKLYQFVVAGSGQCNSYLQQFCQHVAFYIHSATFSAIPFVILITGACQPQPEQSACGLEGFVCCLALLRGTSLVQHGGEQHAGEKIDGGW